MGVDAKDGKVAVHGWLDVLDVDMFDFLQHLVELKVDTVIVTDISKDGAMQGTNLALYEKLSGLKDIHVTASGGVSSYEDIRALKKMKLYGAILGKAMYQGVVELSEALRIVNDEAE